MEEKDLPTLEEIERELAAYRKFQEAYRRGDRPLPELPGGERGPSNIIVLAGGGVLHFGLKLLGLCAKQFRLHRVRRWAASKRVSLDRLWFEPASCGLNSALTELGLALLEIGDTVGASICLAHSGRVYPCPHSTTFGLDPRLWAALKEFPESDSVRVEYEHIAKGFCLGSAWPRKHRALDRER